MPGNDSATKLLLHGEGTDEGSVYTDSCAGATAHDMQNDGTGARTDTAQFKFGSSSIRIGTAGSGYIYVNSAGTDFAFGTGDFAIDFWVRFSATTGAQTIYAGGTLATSKVTIDKQSGNAIAFLDSAVRLQSTTTVVIDTWYHVALTRGSGTTRLFINGTSEGGTFTDGNTYTLQNLRPIIGADTAGSNSVRGWIDELRISVGDSRWTANFTPPTEAYDIPVIGAPIWLVTA